MKSISTTVRTGSEFKIGDSLYRVGMIRKGKIKISVIISPGSSCSEEISTQALNNLLKSAIITSY